MARWPVLIQATYQNQESARPPYDGRDQGLLLEEYIKCRGVFLKASEQPPDFLSAVRIRGRLAGQITASSEILDLFRGAPELDVVEIN